MAVRDPWLGAKPVTHLRRDPDATAATATIFAALSHPLRLRILAWLQHGPHSLGDLSSCLEVDKQLLSHHLVRLRDARMIRCEGRKWSIDPGALPQTQKLLEPALREF